MIQSNSHYELLITLRCVSKRSQDFMVHEKITSGFIIDRYIHSKMIGLCDVFENQKKYYLQLFRTINCRKKDVIVGLCVITMGSKAKNGA